MKSLNKKYNISQEILYTVCLAAWNLCNRNLQKFADLKAYYTEAFIADAVEAVKAAKQLPGLCQTSSARQEARIELMSSARQVMDNWQLLKRYIYEAFDKNMVAISLQAAGDSLYKKAALYNWSALRSLINTSNIFIANNLDKLTANGNMPAGFQNIFEAVGENYIALSENFAGIKMDKEMATQMKIEANNGIYTTVIEMLKDGQQIFKDNVIMKRMFIFKHLVSIQCGAGVASLKGYIRNSINQPIEGVTIWSQDQKYTATTNAKGYYRIPRIAEGTYTFNITSPGFNSLVQTITFAEGTARKEDFMLKNQMQRVA
jgi:hypothetical protein